MSALASGDCRPGAGREGAARLCRGCAVGSGSFGLVLAGQHQQTGSPVAIKMMEAGNSEGVTLDFAAEARVLGGSDRPHVVRAFDYVEAEGLYLSPRSRSSPARHERNTSPGRIVNCRGRMLRASPV